MPDIVILMMVWGAIVVALVFGISGVALHVKDEIRKGHKAVWIYGPLLLAGMIAFGVWVVNSWILNWGN